MNYLFILGRNPELSEAEIFSYLEKENIPVSKKESSLNALLVETGKVLDLQQAIKSLGGTIAIGRILFSGKLEELSAKLKKEEIYLEEAIKFQYSVLNFSDEETFSQLLDAIKEKFKEEKLKARYSSTRGMVKLQDSSLVLGSPSKIKEQTYFLFGKNNLNFGII